VLYSGLKAQDAQSMAARLAAKNIPYEISPMARAFWCPRKNSTRRVWNRGAGLPRNARLGFELFDTPNWAGSTSARR